MFATGVTCHCSAAIRIEYNHHMKDLTLERGILGAFRFFIGIRLLLWLILYVSEGDAVARPALSQFGLQIFMLTFVPDLLVLLALLWPRTRLKMNQRRFGWLLMVSTAVLLIGHAILLSFPAIQGSHNSAAYSTRYSILLFTTVVFVAWQYELQIVLLFGSGTIGLLLLLLWQFEVMTLGSLAVKIFAGLLTILLPGWIIAHLMVKQRQQRASLAAATEEQARTNQQLVHYAASLEELTISRERNRLARELHDTLAHSLSAVTVQLGAVKTLLGSNPDAAKALLDQADDSARDGLQEARRALQALRASPLEDLGLVLALEGLAKEAAVRAGVPLHCDVPEEKLTFLEPHIEQGIYRVAQEALENCVRHAEAKTLWVTMIYSAEQIQLTIRDDGQGFDPSQTIPTDRYGIAGMEERASVIGGMLQVESSYGEGTTVQLVVPLREIKS